MSTTDPEWLEAVRWNDEGLVPAIAQDHDSGRVLTLAWMNRESLARSVQEQRAVYWSRGRRRLWRKGETSGHEQRIVEIRLDCDNDTVLLRVEQAGGIACHTGHAACFFRRLQGPAWVEAEPVLKEPAEIYGSSGNHDE